MFEDIHTTFLKMFLQSVWRHVCLYLFKMLKEMAEDCAKLFKHVQKGTSLIKIDQKGLRFIKIKQYSSK